MSKILKYSEAIYEGFTQLLDEDEDVFIIGQGLWSPWYVGATMTDFEKKYGKDRILDSPVSENATTGVAIGAALAGKKSIVVHPRMDFMLLAMDPIINQASNWSYIFNGQVPVPIVIRSIINRGGEQGAQHSQALQSFFSHVPGIKVVMPATPEDAKGLLLGSMIDKNPVIFIDDRWCYDIKGEVEDGYSPIRLGKAKVELKGSDLTIVASSYLVNESLKAAKNLEKQGLSAEVINLRTIKPWDKESVLNSVKKTKRIIIADSGWFEGGITAEIAAFVYGKCWGLKNLLRIALPNSPAPCSRTLEEAYYPKSETIFEAAKILMSDKEIPHIECLTKDIPGIISY